MCYRKKCKAVTDNTNHTSHNHQLSSSFIMFLCVVRNRRMVETGTIPTTHGGGGHHRRYCQEKTAVGYTEEPN